MHANYLIKNKLDPKEADFEIRKEELESLEKQGFLTMLDKPLPRLTFDYDLNSSFVISCPKIPSSFFQCSICTVVSEWQLFAIFYTINEFLEIFVICNTILQQISYVA